MSISKTSNKENQPTFFDFAAEVGLTKHIGSVKATQALIELCHIGKGSYVLDVGCGVGATACFLARQVGCRVMGVDIREKMVERSRERAARENVVDKVEFKVADVQDLPFADNLFDAVLSESVTAFPEDKQKAVNEYARVTKSGGYMGLNESAWLKVPPPPEVIAWAEQDIGASVKPLTPEEWARLLQGAGLKEIVNQTYTINVQDETKGILQRYGFTGMMRILGRTLQLYTRSPAYRDFAKGVRQGGIVPDNLTEYFGYGLFVGQK
jgi:arsenite methyltransferase